jgi:L-rhamnonate dehydratase
MKITAVRTVQPIAANSPPDWRTSMGQILVAVDTDTGLTGYGVGGGGAAGMHVIRAMLRDLLLGQDPERIGELWQMMYDATLAFGRKGIAIMAISGVDLALWDLRGKAEQRPVAALLGGEIDKPLSTYATVWDEIPDEVLQAHQAFKLHVGKVDSRGLQEEVVRRVAAARERIGNGRALMIDAWMKWDVPRTLAIAEQIQPYQVDWIEEPLSPDDLRGYAELRDRCPVAIAGGEHEFTALGFQELIEQRLHRIVQPDVCWCGGLTELIKIYRMAGDHGVRVCPHRGAEVWGLHAIAALDPQPLAESGRPWMTWVNGQPEIQKGFIQVTDCPGFGVDFNENLWKSGNRD